MNLTATKNREFLGHFVKAFAKAYISEVNFLKRNKNLLQIPEYLSLSNQKKLKKLMSHEEYKKLFTAVEDLARFHVYNILPPLNFMLSKLGVEINELIKMELRRLNLLNDNNPAPDNDFILDNELERFIKVVSEEEYIEGELFITETLTCDPDIQNERDEIENNLQQSLKNIYNSTQCQELIEHGFNQNYAQIIWLVQQSRQAVLHNKNKKAIDKSFSEYLQYDFFECYAKISEHQNQITQFFKEMSIACENAFNLTDSALLQRSKELITALEYVQSSIKELDYKQESALTATVPEQQLKANNYLKDIYKQQSKQQAVVPITKIFIQSVHEVYLSNWQDFFDFDLLKQEFADVDILFHKHSKRNQSILILNNYGACIIEIKPHRNFGDEIDAISFSLKVENIKVEQDFEISKIILIKIINAFNKDNYASINIDCPDSELAKELCESSFAHNIPYIKLSKSTKDNIIRYGAQDLSLMEITVFPELTNIVKQTQNILDLGFIPDLNEESLETLRIITMAFYENCQQHIHLGFGLHLTNENMPIAFEQLKYFYQNGIGVGFTKNIKTSLSNFCLKKQYLKQVTVRALTLVDLKLRIEHILELNITPAIEELVTKDLAKNLPIIKLTSSNLETLIEQITQCCQIGVPVCFPSQHLGRKVAHCMQNNDNSPLSLNFPKSQTTLDMAHYLASFGINFTLEKYSIDKVISLAQKNNLFKISCKVLDYKQFINLLEHGFVPQLSASDIKAIAALIPDEKINIQFKSYPIQCGQLLIEQSQLIEQLNNHLASPIRYFIDSTTESNNSLQIFTLLNEKINSYVEQCHQKIDFFSNNANGYLNLAQALAHNLKSINSNQSMGPLSKIAALEGEILSEKYAIHAFKDLLEQLLQPIEALQRIIYGLCFNANKTTFVQHTNRKMRYIQLAKQQAAQLNQQLLTRVKQLSVTKPKLTSNYSEQAHTMQFTGMGLELPSTRELELIQEAKPLDDANMQLLSKRMAYERLQFLGREIAKGLVITKDYQNEMRVLALKLSEAEPEN